MMRRVAALLLTALLATACGQAEVAGNGNQPRIRMANEHHEGLLRLSPDLQRIGLMRAVRQTGNRCQRVDNAGYQEEYRNMRMWVAQCGVEGRSFAVFIAPNGDVQVRNCAEAGQLSLPRCQPLPPAAPAQGGPRFQEGASDKAFRNEFLK
jgi:hypothetical protein